MLSYLCRLLRNLRSNLHLTILHPFMHYLIAVAPGSVNYGGQVIRLFANSILPVEDAAAPDLLSSYSFLRFSSSDSPAEDKTKQLSPISTLNVKVPDRENAPDKNVDNVDLILNLSPNASIAEAVSYINTLNNLDPKPVFKIQRIAELYPRSKQIQSLCASILVDQSSSVKTEDKTEDKAEDNIVTIKNNSVAELDNKIEPKIKKKVEEAAAELTLDIL